MDATLIHSNHTITAKQADRGVGADTKLNRLASAFANRWLMAQALPLVAAWLIAETIFTSPSFSLNAMAFVLTWYALDGIFVRMPRLILAVAKGKTTL
jgi:hypothetical protein